MRRPEMIKDKILTAEMLGPTLKRWRLINKSIAFTNGCFDILHVGHLASLSKAAEEADILIVGVNSDASTKRLKGISRPINTEHDRALLLAALIMVDAVIIFDEDTPRQLINTIEPDVLVKGGDYRLEQIVGANEVISNGGRVVINDLINGYSTTGLIQKINQL